MTRTLHIKSDPLAAIGNQITNLTDNVAQQVGEQAIKMNELTEQIATLEQKSDSAHAYSHAGHAPTTWGSEFIQKNASQLHNLSQASRGSVDLQIKALTSRPASGGSLAQPDRDDFELMPVAPVVMRDLLKVVQVSTGSVEYAEQTARSENAAVVAEGGLKPESNIAFSLRTTQIRTIAHWVKASRQILDDAPMLRDVIDNDLRAGLAAEEENQLINGNGVDQSLDGLHGHATVYEDPLNMIDPTILDMLASGMLQCAINGYPATGIVMDHATWARIRLIKDADGHYLMGGVQTSVAPTIFGLPVVLTKAVMAGRFMLGDFKAAATLYDRWAPRVEVEYVNDDFTKNLVTILAEQRIGLAVKEPGAIILGTIPVN